MIQSGITTLDMSGTTEVPAISISAASQGTKVCKLRVDMTGASVNATAKLYEAGVANKTYEKALTAGEMVDIATAIGILEETVLKLTPAGGGGSAVPITVKAVTENVVVQKLGRYVAPTGNDGGTGLADDPWLTFDYALTNVPDYCNLHVMGEVSCANNVAPDNIGLRVIGGAGAAINFGSNSFSAEGSSIIFEDIEFIATSGENIYYSFGVQFIRCKFTYSGGAYAVFYYGLLKDCISPSDWIPYNASGCDFTGAINHLTLGPNYYPRIISDCVFWEDVTIDMEGTAADFVNCVFMADLTITNGGGHFLIDCRVMGTKSLAGITEINSEQWAKETSASAIRASIVNNLKRAIRKTAPSAANEIKDEP